MNLKLINYIKDYLNIYNIGSSLKIFFYSIIKQNTRYPNYLLDFERKTSSYFGSKYALTFSNGTTACTALLYSLSVKKGSKVLISKLNTIDGSKNSATGIKKELYKMKG